VLARVVRSGVTESLHDGAIAVVDVVGRVIATQGDVDRRFFARSSVKPFQAHVSQTSGADLPPEWLAVASSSHDGTPAQLAIVRVMLDSAGLTESDLGCPPAWPLAMSSRSRLLLGGQYHPLRIYHNCSGKHSGFLRACLASGWDATSYLSPDHPIQARVRSLLGREPGDG
jgi:L-asparaginase II